MCFNFFLKSKCKIVIWNGASTNAERLLRNDIAEEIKFIKIKRINNFISMSLHRVINESFNAFKKSGLPCIKILWIKNQIQLKSTEIWPEQTPRQIVEDYSFLIKSIILIFDHHKARIFLFFERWLNKCPFKFNYFLSLSLIF